MGYEMMQVPPYVLEAYRDERTYEKSLEALQSADVVIAGSAPKELVQLCMKRNKLLFRYSERPLRNGVNPFTYLPRFLMWHFRNPFYRRIYLLCASAFTAGDYRKFGLFRNRAYKWGYFPETRRYENVDRLFASKDGRQILWVARLLKLKHPEYPIMVAKKLREEGYDFSMKLIGGGEEEENLKQLIVQYDLSSHVELCGYMDPNTVRMHMERAGIFLFTSDKREGWGAVLNEAMNSGCAVVSADEIGATPYLVDNGKNGFIFKSGDVEELYEKTKFLLDSPHTQERLGREAYRTITDLWNAGTAANRLLELSDELLKGRKPIRIFTSGPCSPAESTKG